VIVIALTLAAVTAPLAVVRDDALQEGVHLRGRAHRLGVSSPMSVSTHASQGTNSPTVTVPSSSSLEVGKQPRELLTAAIAGPVHTRRPPVAPVLAVGDEGHVAAVQEALGHAQRRPAREGEVAGLHDLLRRGRRGEATTVGTRPGHNSMHDRAVRGSHRLEPAVRQRAKKGQVAEEWKAQGDGRSRRRPSMLDGEPFLFLMAKSSERAAMNSSSATNGTSRAR
jgi:hypothetical protein